MAAEDAFWQDVAHAVAKAEHRPGTMFDDLRPPYRSPGKGTLSPFPQRTGKRIEALPWWPEPATVVKLAVAAAAEAEPFAIGAKFKDGSEIAIGYETRRQYGVPAEIYDRATPPLLYVVVLDHGAGVGRDRGGLTLRTKPNDAEQALVDLRNYLGREPVGIIAAGINPRDSSRRYWFGGV